MSPRIPVSSHLNLSTLCFRPASKPLLPITSILNASTLAQRNKHRDPYAVAQANQRKDANLSRQEQLRQERTAALGDPVRGTLTPFVQSFSTVGGAIPSPVDTLETSQGSEARSADAPLNHFISASELAASLQHSYSLTEPQTSITRAFRDPAVEEAEREEHLKGHERAQAAIARIVSLENGSQKDRTRANIRRCISTFGRHETDSILRPRAPTNPDIAGAAMPEKTPRAGPDTGSSEVQIAILTAKIKVLADLQEAKRGRKDKVNKRNLRLLVHRRQKLLRYLQKKERGSDRWQNLVQTLGLTDGTWRGEISL